MYRRRSDADLAADFRIPAFRAGWLSGQLRDARDTLLAVEASLAVNDPGFLLSLVAMEIDGINRAIAVTEAAELDPVELRRRADSASWAGRLRRLDSPDPLPGESDASSWISIGDAAATVVAGIPLRSAA
jgi:hypothetical protein